VIASQRGGSIVGPIETISCKVPKPVKERYVRIADAEGNQLSAVVRRILIGALPQAERDAPPMSTQSPVERPKRRA
jgi:hypothetical protein